jgi:hypothetical protein
VTIIVQFIQRIILLCASITPKSHIELIVSQLYINTDFISQLTILYYRQANKVILRNVTKQYILITNAPILEANIQRQLIHRQSFWIRVVEEKCSEYTLNCGQSVPPPAQAHYYCKIIMI